MLRKIIVTFITSVLVLISTPASAGDDWGWYTGNIYHPKYFVMNIENEGHITYGCVSRAEIGKTYDLQIKNGKGKKAKWKTEATFSMSSNRFDYGKTEGWYTFCSDPNQIVVVTAWNPPDWQKDYQARIRIDKKVWSTFSIVIHPNLKRNKPIIQY
jgi:hypothetical protein